MDEPIIFHKPNRKIREQDDRLLDSNQINPQFMKPMVGQRNSNLSHELVKINEDAQLSFKNYLLIYE